MSGKLTLCEAARQSGIGLHGLMKAIWSNELNASRCEPDGFMVLQRDLDRYLSRRRSAAVATLPDAPKALPQPLPGSSDLPESIKRVREAFGKTQLPAPEPASREPAPPPARDLGDWCESYLIQLRKVDWHLRKLEADAAWLNETLTRR
jgi:hypothetical protein